MKIALIVAMDKELNLILSNMEKYDERHIDKFTAYFGVLNGNDILVAKCGIGKVNAALRTLEIIQNFSPDLVINSGVAGGVDEKMRIGDVLVAESVAYHDVWCGPGTMYGAPDGFPVYLLSDSTAMQCMREVSKDSDSKVVYGLLCSGDKFISEPEQVAKIKANFPEALGCDMESGAIAQTCKMCGVPFIVVRVMSDMPGGGENISEYQNFWGEAPMKTFEIVFKLIGSLGNAEIKK